MQYFIKTNNINAIDEVSSKIRYDQTLLYYTASAYMEFKAYNKALEFLKSCIFLNSQNPFCIYNSAIIYDKKSDMKNAIAFYVSFVKSCRDSSVSSLTICNNVDSVLKRLSYLGVTV